MGWDSVAVVWKRNPYHLLNEGLPVALLYGKNTASAGEVVAISFRGKENTQSFGQETAGATTRVDNFRLSDGAYLNLAAGYDVDRNGVVFGGTIIPDHLTPDHDSAMREAKNWISERRKIENK